MKKNKDPRLSEATERKLKYISNVTKQEINAALKLIELLYLQGEIPQHVYRNICNEYFDKGVDITNGACYTITTARKDAV